MGKAWDLFGWLHSGIIFLESERPRKII